MRSRPSPRMLCLILESAGCLFLLVGTLLIWLRWVGGPIPLPAEADLRWDRAQVDIMPGTPVAFEIRPPKGGLTGVEVGLVNHRHIGCLVGMKLYRLEGEDEWPAARKTARLVGQRAIRILSFEPGKNFTFVFPPISDSRGSRFIAEFSLVGAAKGSIMGLAGSPGGSLFRNGKVLPVRVAHRLYYDRSGSEAWGIGLGLLGVLLAAVGLWYGGKSSRSPTLPLSRLGKPALDRPLLLMEGQRLLCSPPGVRKRLLVYGLLGILFWQALMLAQAYPGKVDASYRVGATTGVMLWHRDFVYFLYYLGLYPVVSEDPHALDYSREGARRLWRQKGSSLVMERYWTSRLGEHGKVFLYLPHAWLRGGPVPEPMLIPFNAMFFTSGLLLLFAAMWALGWPLFGLILVILLGSDPFQIFEVYGNNNVMGIPISTAIWILAIMSLLMGKARSIRWVWLAPLLVGVLVGCLSMARTEPVILLAPALLLCLFAPGRRWVTRIFLCAVLMISFLGTSSWLNHRLDEKFSHTARMVAQAGGHPFVGARINHHLIWHPIWCGLGDFGKDKGYAWDDEVANQYAWNILRRDYPQGKPPGWPPNRDMGNELTHYTLGTFWDRDCRYPRTIWELPGYSRVIRAKVLKDILGDPLWYAKIIGLRVWRILTKTTPPRLRLGPLSLPVLPSSQWYGLLFIPVALILFLRRAWLPLVILLFTLPLAAVPLLIYSGRGTTYYSLFHLFALGLCLAWIWEIRLRRLNRDIPASGQTGAKENNTTRIS